MSDAPLPESCDVLVVGAGPAGSACAQHAGARRAAHVLLVDQHDFPRDKVCGDGLIPDAHAALRRLGVHDEVMAQAQAGAARGAASARAAAASTCPGTVAVLPRKRARRHPGARRAARRRAAAHAGALRAPLLDGERVVGARLKAGEQVHESARALGGAGHRRGAAGADRRRLCERRTPSGIALRGYVKNDAMVGRIARSRSSGTSG